MITRRGDVVGVEMSYDHNGVWISPPDGNKDFMKWLNERDFHVSQELRLSITDQPVRVLKNTYSAGVVELGDDGLMAVNYFWFNAEQEDFAVEFMLRWA